MDYGNLCETCAKVVPQNSGPGPIRRYCPPEADERVSLCRRLVNVLAEADALIERVKGRNGGKFGAALRSRSGTYWLLSNQFREQPYPYGRVAAGKPGAGRFLPRNGVELEEVRGNEEAVR